jgi:hypothetical protein
LPLSLLRRGVVEGAMAEGRRAVVVVLVPQASAGSDLLLRRASM